MTCPPESPAPTTDLAVLDAVVRPAGKTIVDIGCGDGGLARALAARHAEVIAVETDEAKVGAAAGRDRGTGVSYRVGYAQALPLDDGSVDVAVFMRTLHHVPAAELHRALVEARRVLTPNGLVYIAEPQAYGDFYALVSLVEDETSARAAAQAALARAPEAGLTRVSATGYEVAVALRGVAALRDRIVAVDAGRAEVFDRREKEIARAFHRLGAPGNAPGERSFRAPMRADMLVRAG